MADESEKQRCWFCDSSTLTQDKASMVCSACGTMNEQLLYVHEERSVTAASSSDGQRIASTNTTHSMASQITSASDPLLPKQSNHQLFFKTRGGSHEVRRMRLQHKWQQALSARDRELLRLFDALDACDVSPAVSHQAKTMLQMAWTSGHVFKGKARKGLPAACMYLACKQYNVHRSVQEVAQWFGGDVPQTAITAAHKLLINMETINELQRNAVTQETDCMASFINRFASLAKLSMAETTMVRDIAAQGQKVTSNRSDVLAAASVCLVLDVQGHTAPSLEQLAASTMVSVASITRCRKKLLDAL